MDAPPQPPQQAPPLLPAAPLSPHGALTLPDVLTHVLSFLPLSDVLTCRLVCRQFSRGAEPGAPGVFPPLAAGRLRRALALPAGARRLALDPVLSGGLPWMRLLRNVPPAWPSALDAQQFWARLKIMALDDGAAGPRPRRVRYYGGKEGDRVVVANAPLPALPDKNERPSRRRHSTVPFVWAHCDPAPARAAGASGGGRGGVDSGTATAAAASSSTSPGSPPARAAAAGGGGGRAALPTYHVGAHLVAYYEVTITEAPPLKPDQAAAQPGGAPPPVSAPAPSAAPPRAAASGGGGGAAADGASTSSSDSDDEEPDDDNDGFFARPACVAVGLASKPFPISGRQPGWDRNSFGWHGDDGNVFHGSGAGQPFGPRFGVGDVVGCGIVYCGATPSAPYVPRRPPPVVPPQPARAGAPSENAASAGDNEDDDDDDYRDGTGPSRRLAFGQRPVTHSRAEPHDEDALLAAWDLSRPSVFYTLNGRLMGCAFRGVDVTRRWYPVVGIDCPEAISFNFGSEPFAYDVGRLSRRLWADAILERLPGFLEAGALATLPTRPSATVFGVAADDQAAAGRLPAEEDRATVAIALDAAVRYWNGRAAAWIERRRRLRHLHTLQPRRKGALASSVAGVEGAGAGIGGGGGGDVDMADVTAAGGGGGGGTAPGTHHGLPASGSGRGDGGDDGGAGSSGHSTGGSSGPAPPPLQKRSRTLSADDDAGGAGRPSPPADPAPAAAADGAAAAAAARESGGSDAGSTDEDGGSDDGVSGEWQLRPRLRGGALNALINQWLVAAGGHAGAGGEGAGADGGGEFDDEDDVDDDDDDDEDFFDDEDDEDDADMEDDDGGDWFDDAAGGDGDGDGDDLSLPSLGPEEKDMLRRAILRAAEAGAAAGAGGDHERAVAHALAQDDDYVSGSGGGGATGASAGAGAAAAPSARGGVPVVLPTHQQRAPPAAAASDAAAVAPPPPAGAALQLGLPPPPPSALAAAGGGRGGVPLFGGSVATGPGGSPELPLPPGASVGGGGFGMSPRDHPLSRISRASASSDGAVSTSDGGDPLEASAASLGGGSSSSAAAISMLLPTALRLTGGRVSGGAGGNTPLPAPALHSGSGGGAPLPPGGGTGDDEDDDDDDDSDVRSVVSRS